MYLYWFISSIDIRCFKAIFLIWFLFSLTSLVAQMVKHLSTMWETQVQSLVGKIPWRRKWQSTPVLLPGKPHGQRSLVGYSPRGCKESTEWLTLSTRLKHKISQLTARLPHCSTGPLETHIWNVSTFVVMLEHIFLILFSIQPWGKDESL